MVNTFIKMQLKKNRQSVKIKESKHINILENINGKC